MTAPRFLGVDLATRPDLSGVSLRERVRCPGRSTTIKTQSCGKSDRPAPLVVVDEFFV